MYCAVTCTVLSRSLCSSPRVSGVPARVAGTPSWVVDQRAVGDRWNNHNWVELWDGASWSFVGAAEPDVRGFNRTWFFPQPAKRQVGKIKGC